MISFHIDVDVDIEHLPKPQKEELLEKLQTWAEIELAVKATELFDSPISQVDCTCSNPNPNSIDAIWEAIPDFYSIKKKKDKSYLKTKDGSKLERVEVEEVDHYKVYHLTFSSRVTRDSLLAFLEWSGALGIPLPSIKERSFFKPQVKGQGIIPQEVKPNEWILKVPSYHWEELPSHYYSGISSKFINHHSNSQKELVA
jgi:hypothetical protein